MQVLVLGSTGATGRLVTEQALMRGHTVTALARDPAKLGIDHPKLRVVQGDVTRLLSLEPAMAGQEAVVFCVGPGSAVKESTVRADGARVAVAAMTAAGVRRIIALSGLGAGVSRKSQGFFFDKIAAPLLKRGVLEDQNGLEAEMRKSKLDWIVVRPGEMTEADGKGKWAVSLDGSGITRQIARRDVVAFLLDQLQSDEFLRLTPAIGY